MEETINTQNNSMEKNPIEAREFDPVPSHSKKRFWVGIFVLTLGLLIVFALGIFYIFSNGFSNTSRGNLGNENGLLNQIQPSPTPLPFAEMTIPGLRARSFESSLGELNEVSSNAIYTSYLTSYNSDGFRVNAQLTKPAGEEPAGGWPAIIFVHGYIPPANYQTLSNYADYVDYLARNGFVVFKIDLRGHGDSEGEAGGGYYSSDYIVDVLNARAALANSDFVNPDSIGLWGHSMAGNVISRAMAAKPEIPAISIWAGAVYTYEDMQKFGIDDNSYRPPSEDSPGRQRRNQLFETHGNFDPTHPFWKQVPMTNYLSDITGAIQLNHAQDDAVVNIGYSRDLASLLEGAGITHELNEYSSGGHNISGASFNSAMQNTVEFFKENL